MPPSLKRKGSPGLEDSEASPKRQLTTPDDHGSTQPLDSTNVEPSEEASEADANEPVDISLTTSTAASDRAARFAALRARRNDGRKSNLRETKSEAQRAAINPTALTALTRKKDIATHKLLQAETEEAGEDFERKRAWDWTVDEAERWDARQAAKQRARDNVAFHDYSQEAAKIYDRQLLGMDKAAGLEARRAAYEAERNEAIERAVRSGGLELVETADGDVMAVDRDGSFFRGGVVDPGAAAANKAAAAAPSREAVDRLVADIKKAEEIRLKKRRERGIKDADDAGDVTYINEKNKQFNMKLARFYNKYTADIRESFERGTAM